MDIDQNKIRRLDFSLLLIFDALLRHERTTVVAEQLGLSQPAISHALTRLRDLFGDPLFTRRPDGLTPTRRALELAPKVRDLLRLTQDVVGGPPPFEPLASNRCFNLAANDLISTLFGPLLLETLAREAPATRLTTQFAVGAAALEAMRKDDLDLAIGRFYGPPDDFLTETLFTERFSVVVRNRHPAIGEGLDLPAFLAVDHLLVSFSGKLTGVVDEALAGLGEKRCVRASVPTFLTAFAAVAASNLVATVPTRLAKRFAAAFCLRVLDPPVAIQGFPVSLVRHASTLTDPGLSWFIDRVRHVSQELG